MISKRDRPQSPTTLFFFFLAACATSLRSFSTALSTPSPANKFKKTALVTGATDGIGLTTAKNLAKKGYRVIIHGRDPTRIKSACQKIRSVSPLGFSSAVPAMADLSTIAGCRQLVTTTSTYCQTHDTGLDVIVNNAGVFSSQKKIVGEHGLEQTFAVNVLAPFVVTSLLLPLLTVRDGSRVVIVSSVSQCGDLEWGNFVRCEDGYSGHRAYSESKLLDAMLSNEFAERLAVLGTKRVTVNSLDPGTVNTKMLLDGWGRCGIDVEDALDQTWIASSEELEGVSGKYFVGRSERRPGKPAMDSEQRKRLWGVLSEYAPDEVETTWEVVLRAGVKGPTD